MSLPVLPPDASDTEFTVTFPKEFTPYLRDLFYPLKKRDESETIEQYIVRVVLEKGIQTYQLEALNSIQSTEVGQVMALVDNMNKLV